MGFDEITCKIYQFPVVDSNPQIAAPEVGATEETDAQLTTYDAGEKSKSAGRAFLGAGRGSFSPEVFKNPDVAPIIARFLIDDCEKHEQEKAELRGELRGLHKQNDTLKAEISDQKVDVATLNAKARVSKVNEILYVVSMAIGSRAACFWTASRDSREVPERLRYEGVSCWVSQAHRDDCPPFMPHFQHLNVTF